MRPAVEVATVAAVAHHQPMHFRRHQSKYLQYPDTRADGAIPTRVRVGKFKKKRTSQRRQKMKTVQKQNQRQEKSQKESQRRKEKQKLTLRKRRIQAT